MSIKGTFLEKIVRDKTIWIEARKTEQPLNTFRHTLQPTRRRFYDALRDKKTVFILECKKASPSKGLICKYFDPIGIAEIYRHYASAVSVLTDEKYFQGDLAFLPIVSTVVKQPVLCKDFIIDQYQIYLARYYQADAILLMLSILNNEQYQHLALVAHSLQMGVLTEISNEEELERAIALNAKVVGINNRNLRDLSIDLNHTRQLAPRLGLCVTVISESGIHNYTQVRELRRFVNGFLIGSALMKKKDLNTAVRRVLMGDNKICGLTRAEDARSAYKAGAIYGGVIFAEDSLRKVSKAQAQALMTAAPLKYVCVFRNNSISDILTLVTALHFDAVQLHGNEDRKFVAELRQALPVDVKIWKAFSIIKGELPVQDWEHIDRYVFDNGQGGTGQCFDWSLLKGQDLSNVILAGGLSTNNCVEAAQLGCAGLDFNSGVESATGIKDASKIEAVFRILRF